MRLISSNAVPLLPGAETLPSTTPPAPSNTKNSLLGALRAVSWEFLRPLATPRIAALLGVTAMLTACASAPTTKRITPLEGPLYEKTPLRTDYLPAGTFEENEMKIKFYHPFVKLAGRPVVVCFCNKKCTRWPDNYAFNSNCGHKDKDGKPQGFVILMDKAVYESELRAYEGGPKLKHVDESLKITPLPPYKEPQSM